MAGWGEYEKKLAQLAASLERYGIDSKFSGTMAAGILFKLMNWCWANLTDIVGDSQTMDSIIEAPLPAGVVSRLLYKYGIVAVDKGRYYLPSAYVDRPTRIDRKWRRQSPRSYANAKERAENPPRARLFNFEEEEYKVEIKTEPAHEPEPAPPVKKKKGSKHDGTPGHPELVAYWCKQWAEKVGRGNKYPFCALDGKSIKSLIERTESIEQAKLVIDAYLECRDKFYAGKELKRLVGSLPRFIAEASGASRPDELPYAGKDSGFNIIEHNDL